MISKVEQTMSQHEFIHTGTHLVPIGAITEIDLSNFDLQGVLKVTTSLGTYTCCGVYAIETLLALKPSALEGTPVRWLRGSWTVHNMIGHPLLEILARLGLARWGLRVHDWTVPGKDKLKPQT